MSLSDQNEVITDIDGDRQKLVVGEQRVIPERRGKISLFGITPMDVNYKITLTYKGERDNRAYFDMTVQTSKQVPDILLKRLLPLRLMHDLPEVGLYENQAYNHIFWITVPRTALLRVHQYDPASPVTDLCPDDTHGDTIAKPNHSPVSECAGP